MGFYSTYDPNLEKRHFLAETNSERQAQIPLAFWTVPNWTGASDSPVVLILFLLPHYLTYWVGPQFSDRRGTGRFCFGGGSGNKLNRRYYYTDRQTRNITRTGNRPFPVYYYY